MLELVLGLFLTLPFNFQTGTKMRLFASLQNSLSLGLGSLGSVPFPALGVPGAIGTAWKRQELPARDP